MLSPVAAFLVLIVLFGPILVLIDIRKSVRSLEAVKRGRGSDDATLPIEHREPHF